MSGNEQQISLGGGSHTHGIAGGDDWGNAHSIPYSGTNGFNGVNITKNLRYFTQTGNGTQCLQSSGVTVSGKITPSVSGSLSSSDVETRPTNYTVRIWKRVS